LVSDLLHHSLDWDGKKIFIRFGSVNYLASVWLNGKFIGQHEGGHLPFEFDITEDVLSGKNLWLSAWMAPWLQIGFRRETCPPTHEMCLFFRIIQPRILIFFPFCGIHRQVWIYAKHPAGIDDLIVATDVSGTTGTVKVKVMSTARNASVGFFLSGHGTQTGQQSAISNREARNRVYRYRRSILGTWCSKFIYFESRTIPGRPDN